LSHSEISGSQAASAYPKLIAGNHVLLRLSVPRHPPYALCNFTKNVHNTDSRQRLFAKTPYYFSASLQCSVPKSSLILPGSRSLSYPGPHQLLLRYLLTGSTDTLKISLKTTDQPFLNYARYLRSQSPQAFLLEVTASIYLILKLSHSRFFTLPLGFRLPENDSNTHRFACQRTSPFVKGTV
jgi:hypothetical protein